MGDRVAAAAVPALVEGEKHRCPARQGGAELDVFVVHREVDGAAALAERSSAGGLVVLYWSTASATVWPVNRFLSSMVAMGRPFMNRVMSRERWRSSLL